MSVESHNFGKGADAQKLAQIFGTLSIPSDLLQNLMELSKTYGPELLTAVLGYVSIQVINWGSAKYGDLNTAADETEARTIKKDASRQIALGGLGMMTVAFAAANPRFAYPEIIALVGALKPYLEASSQKFETFSKAMRLDWFVKAAAVGVGTYVAVEHAHSPMEVLPPAGLTALSLAFSGMRQDFYRILTVTGGSALVLGSAHSAVEAMQANNTVGVIMSTAFFALNALFTRNEWHEVRKLGGPLKVIESAQGALMEKCKVFVEAVKNLFGRP